MEAKKTLITFTFYLLLVIGAIKTIGSLRAIVYGPNAVPQNSAVSEVDRKKIRSVNIEIGDRGVTYIKVCTSAKIKRIEGEEDIFSIIFRDHPQKTNGVYESIIFLHPYTLSNVESPLKLITENGYINLNVKANTKQKNTVITVGEPLVLEINNILWPFRSGVEDAKIAMESNNEFQLSCEGTLMPNQIDDEVKHFISKYEENKDVDNLIKLAELELKIFLQEKELELQNQKNRLRLMSPSLFPFVG